MLSYCGAGEHSSEAFASKEIKPVSLKGNQPWMFIRRTNAEAPILWPPDSKSWLIGKDPDAGKDWGQEKKGWQGLRCLDGIANPMELSKLWEIVKDRETWRTEVLGVAKCWTWLNNIMQLMDLILRIAFFIWVDTHIIRPVFSLKWKFCRSLVSIVCFYGIRQ